MGSVRLGLMALAALLLGASAATAQHKACPAIPGMQAKECREFTPPDAKPGAMTYWYDTDGIDPGVAGCHVEVRGPNDKTPTGRSFGEACAGGLLVETNPDANVVHGHAGDVGNPNYVNCANWCTEAKGARGGACVPVTAGPSNPKVAPCTRSARCECN